MPLPNITNGTSTRCRARTKSRNLAPCLNLAAYGTPVCRNHGARDPKKQKTGEDHHRFKHGKSTKEAQINKQEQLSNLKQIEDVMFLLGALEGRNHTRGNLPANYQKIKTLQQAKDFIMKLKTKDL